MNSRNPLSASHQGKWLGKFGVEWLDGITSKLDHAVAAVVGGSESNSPTSRSSSSSSSSRSRRTLSFQTDVRAFQADQMGVVQYGETSRRSASRRSVDVSSSFLLSHHSDLASPTSGNVGCVASSSRFAPSGHREDAAPLHRSRVSFDVGPGYRSGRDFEAMNPNSLDEWRRYEDDDSSVDDSDMAEAATSRDGARNQYPGDSGTGAVANIPSYASMNDKDSVASNALAGVPASAIDRGEFQRQSAHGDGSSESSSTTKIPGKELGSTSLKSARRKSDSSCHLKMPMSTVTRARRMSMACGLMDVPPCPPPSPDWILSYRQSFRDDLWSTPPGEGAIRPTIGATELDVDQLTALCKNWYRSGDNAAEYDDDNDVTSEDTTSGTDDAVRVECRTISPIYNPNFDDDIETPPVEEYGYSVGVCELIGELKGMDDVRMRTENLFERRTRDNVRTRREDNMLPAAGLNGNVVSALTGRAFNTDVDRNVVIATDQSKFDAYSILRQSSVTAIAVAGRSPLVDDVITCNRTRQTSVGRVGATDSESFNPKTPDDGKPLGPLSPLTAGNITAQTQYLLVIPSVSLTRPDGENGSVASSPMHNVDVSAAVTSIVAGIQSSHAIRDNEDEDEDADDNSGSTEGCDGNWEVWNNPDEFFDEELDLDPLPVGSLSRRFSERSMYDHANISASLSSSSSGATAGTSQHGSGNSMFDRGREAMVFMADFVQKIFDPL